MAENPMTRNELEEAFWLHRWPVNDILIDHVFQEYHAGPDAGLYTDQDAWEQTRKLAAYFEEHGELPGELGDWMPGWGRRVPRKNGSRNRASWRPRMGPLVLPAESSGDAPSPLKRP